MQRGDFDRSVAVAEWISTRRRALVAHKSNVSFRRPVKIEEWEIG